MDRKSEPSAHVSVHPITDRDLPEVARLLGEHFPPDTPTDQWADAWLATVNRPGSTAPNHGFLLRADGRVVGAYPAIYSTRVINGRLERFCNLAVWFTAPEYRSSSIRMVRAVLGQHDLTFTDLSPIDVVQKLNLRLGFVYLDTATVAVPHLPWIGQTRARVTDDPAVIEATLPEPVRTYYADHAECRWARHVLLVRGDQSCYVVWRRYRIKRLPLFASVQYISNPAVFRESFGALARYLLLHHGTVATIVEDRLTSGGIRPSLRMPRSRQRMFRSSTVGPEHIDYLYSEITSAP
ncbi:hypothetical protein K2F54_05545 [Cryobacterium sp. 1639]|uniref:hypothetical protein n=1 Tax=Cryobacterium inferilacus TaxID=2866629 RepID=UPI001C730133|nr:hypothetical protein [Cryobacterium sp. 1639]MBX0299437.1 hypothetical protein [Cryobacterium sp. 1639]